MSLRTNPRFQVRTEQPRDFLGAVFICTHPFVHTHFIDYDPPPMRGKPKIHRARFLPIRLDGTRQESGFHQTVSRSKSVNKLDSLLLSIGICSSFGSIDGRASQLGSAGVVCLIQPGKRLAYYASRAILLSGCRSMEINPYCRSSLKTCQLDR